MSDERDKAKQEAIDANLAKAEAHPLRRKIVERLRQSPVPLSPNRLSQELGEALGNVSYHVKTLLEYDCVELAKTEPRRGAVEHFYKLTGKGMRLMPHRGDSDTLDAVAELLLGRDVKKDEPDSDEDLDVLADIADLVGRTGRQVVTSE